MAQHRIPGARNLIVQHYLRGRDPRPSGIFPFARWPPGFDRVPRRRAGNLSGLRDLRFRETNAIDRRDAPRVALRRTG